MRGGAGPDFRVPFAGLGGALWVHTLDSLLQPWLVTVLRERFGVLGADGLGSGQPSPLTDVLKVPGAHLRRRVAMVPWCPFARTDAVNNGLGTGTLTSDALSKRSRCPLPE